MAVVCRAGTRVRASVGQFSVVSCQERVEAQDVRRRRRPGAPRRGGLRHRGGGAPQMGAAAQQAVPARAGLLSRSVSALWVALAVCSMDGGFCGCGCGCG